MSKTAKIIASAPHKAKKNMGKAVNRRFRYIEAKVAYEQKTSDPFGLRDRMRQQMLTGKIGYAELEIK